jgi:hypothetical protein
LAPCRQRPCAAAATRLSPDLQERWIAIPIAEWGCTLQSLATSFLAGDRAKARPTLIDLIVKASFRQGLIEGRHEEVGRKWSCAICALDHPIIEPCPAECDDCHRRHHPENVCTSTRLRLEREQAEARRAAADARDQAEAAAAGVSVEELRSQRSAARWQPSPGGLRASLGASRAGTDEGGKAG